MMFRRLKLAGFKSFADTVELDIETGLTGVVGPNGCGKSNIVEAIRWVMGESSAKQMRSDEMDDVIFSGTSGKTARNLAEITLLLDNGMKKAPSEYNDKDEIEIIRKIIRGKGTSFRINNKPVRARDVQLLFADSATGARSAGIVSQGRIGSIVGAKPNERRTLLEEAANIKGLHQRKHEAELRLNNTELNVTRLLDLMSQLEDQKTYLQKQARQAARYRSVAERIRKAEASLLHVQWISENADQQKACIDSELATKSVTQAQIAVNLSTQKRLEIAEKLPGLRKTEASLAAETQLLRTNLFQIERDETRIEDEIERLQLQSSQIEKDSQREEALQNDALEAKNKLNEEAKKLEETEIKNTPLLEEARRELEKARLKNQLAEEKSAEANAVLQNLEKYQAQLKTQIEQKQSLVAQATERLSQINLNELEQSVSEKKAKYKQLNAMNSENVLKSDEQSKKLSNLKTQRDNAFDSHQAALNLQKTLEAEKEVLSKLSQTDTNNEKDPIADSISVSSDMEAALAACLTNNLFLPVGKGIDGYWQAEMPPLEFLIPPKIGTPITAYVKGPVTIIRALQGISVVPEDFLEGDIVTKLELGQAVVTKSGKLARWDGLVRIRQDTGASKLKQNQRLKELDKLIFDSKSDAFKQKTKLKNSEEFLFSANRKFEEIQKDGQILSHKIMQALRDVDTSELAIKNAKERYQMLQQSISEAMADLTEIKSNIFKMDNIGTLKETAKNTAEIASKSRISYDQCVQKEAELRQILESIFSRKKHVFTQINEWQSRIERTKTRMLEMTTRADNASNELSVLKSKPAQLEKERDKLESSLNTASQKHEKAVIQVKETEIILQQADNQQRLDEKHLSEMREIQIRQEAVEKQAKQSIEALINQISEKLSISPDKLSNITSISEEQELPEKYQLEDRIDRLLKERDNIGPVNLRAEIEMEEISQKLVNFEVDRNDLEQAVTRLRKAISELDREARQRLVDSLTKVNLEFARLFKKLFNGGNAELKLVNSDDPLSAGLEILASPPGKKLQSLSLLSGGEQALTGLAIIFAVFLTNPSPICILDEVDAALDDTNVFRFCELLRFIVSQTKTKFLIVTHHRMTMSQMDRLYGVTMVERGISKLVSVDLQTAENLREDL